MGSSLLAHAHAFASNESFATSSVTVHLPASLVVATASLSGFHIKRDAYWPGANAWVSRYRQAGSDQDVDTLEGLRIYQASDLRIERCTRVTFTAAIFEGYAVMVGTVFAADPIDPWVVLPDLPLRYVYDPDTGSIRHTHATIVAEGAQGPDDDELDRTALDTALWLGALAEGSLKVTRGERALPAGTGLRVDPDTGGVVPDPELDLPVRPWLRGRPTTG